jgi:arsenite-transporting ATPase
MTLPLGDRRVIFVGGKGGVGKTTTSAALALHLADSGKRVLVVSTDPAHSLGDVFDQPIGPKPKRLAPNLTGLEIDEDRVVDEYLADVKQSMRSLVQPAMYHEIDRQIELARSSPGAVEAAMLERVAGLMVADDPDYDVLVFDTAPTGQTLRLLTLPEIMAAWTEGLLGHREKSDKLANAMKRLGGGPRGDDLSHFEHAQAAESGDPRFRRIREKLLERRRVFQKARRMLLDPEAVAFLLVLIPERLPILESTKAIAALKEFGVPVAGLVVNRVLPEGPIGDFLEERREQEKEYLRQIDERFRDVPRIRVPLFARDVGGLEPLRQVGAYLFAEPTARSR